MNRPQLHHLFQIHANGRVLLKHGLLAFTATAFLPQREFTVFFLEKNACHELQQHSYTALHTTSNAHYIRAIHDTTFHCTDTRPPPSPCPLKQRHHLKHTHPNPDRKYPPRQHLHRHHRHHHHASWHPPPEQNRSPPNQLAAAAAAANPIAGSRVRVPRVSCTPPGC